MRQNIFPKNTLDISLFDLLRERFRDALPIITCTKATLVHISHSLEEVVLREKLPATIFTGFQESGHWKEETDRYIELAGVARQVCIFAGSPLPPESAASQFHIELADGDKLRQEWFLIILSDRFSVLLCGQDNLIQTDQEATREFETIWTFEPKHIALVLDVLEEVIRRYRPERLQTIQATRQQYTLGMPDAAIFTELTRDMIAFEEKLNRRLRWQNSLTETILYSVSHFVYVEKVTPQGTFTLEYLSPNMPTLAGHPVQQTGRGLHLIPDKAIHPDDRAAFRAYITQLRQYGKESTLEYRLLTPDDETIWMRDTAHTLLADGNRLIFGLLEDITPQKALLILQEEQQKLYLELEKEKEMNVIKSYFMTTISHEFRTPLTIILTASQMLSRYWGSLSEENRQKKFTSIKNQVLYLTKVLDDITIMMENQQAGGFNPVNLPLDAFCQNLIEGYTTYGDMDHQIVYRYTGPQTEIIADANVLQAVLGNLISNAIKYSPADKLIVMEVTPKRETVEINIIDEGRGIPAQDQSRLFQSFQRGSNVSDTAGMGLGLKIVWDGGVRMHDGTITFSSEQNKGTVFNIVLPIKKAPENDAS